MNKPAIAIAVSLAAGFAAGAILLGTSGPEPLIDSSGDSSSHFDPSAATDDRIRALEQAVAEERNARQLLEEELLVLMNEIDALRGESMLQGEERPVGDPGGQEIRETRRAELMRRRQAGSSEEARSAALVAGGFAPDRAAWIVQREDELRVAEMQQRYDAQRAGDWQALRAAGDYSENQLRAELGEFQYEQYLEAYDRPTTVSVGNVLDSSPGQAAGLLNGDEIVRYDGQRVFTYSDINTQQLQGEPGESVVIDILRDGVPMQIVMPRGPIGIQASRNFRR